MEKAAQVADQQKAKSNVRYKKDGHSTDQVDETLNQAKTGHSTKAQREKQVTQLRTRNDSPVKESQNVQQKEQTLVFLGKKEKIRKARLLREQQDQLAQEKAEAHQQQEILKNRPKAKQVQPSHLEDNTFGQLEDLARQRQVKSSQKKEVRDVAKKIESQNEKVLIDPQRKANNESKIKGKREMNQVQDQWGADEEVKQPKTKQLQPDDILAIIDKFENEMNKDEVWNELEKLSSRIQVNLSEREVNRFLGLPDSSSRKQDKEILPPKRIRKAKEVAKSPTEEPDEMQQEYNIAKDRQQKKQTTLHQQPSNNSNVQPKPEKQKLVALPEQRIFKQSEDDSYKKRNPQFAERQREFLNYQKALEKRNMQKGNQQIQ